ncbi:TRAP transporter small permease [Hoeflea poritis]|uniref:TRAP transporter small permease protein n=1 Tax=Hoeflea poritis TaxID=2993659 RepID=A0ABT4VT45_9HYPH|nr:TRAP transporter small permease subunit [Hoeflea poritis]MDA4847859.1 TRAP transporter small permease subunit [Hoeflea poritis]
MTIAWRILSFIARGLELAAVAMMAVMAGFVALSAIMRYAFSAPFAFTEDIVGLLFCGIVFSALANVEFENRHIRIDLLEGVFGDRLAVIQSASRHLLAAGFYLWFAAEALQYFSFVYKAGSATVIGNLPLYPWVGLIVLCLATTFLIVVARLISGNGARARGGA